MHPRTRSSEAIRGHQRRSPWRSPVEEDGDAPKDEGVDDGLSRDGVTCGERGGGRREEQLHANGHLEAASPGGCRQNVAFQYSREIECHDGSRACGERGAMMSTCMHLHALACSLAIECAGSHTAPKLAFALPGSLPLSPRRWNLQMGSDARSHALCKASRRATTSRPPCCTPNAPATSSGRACSERHGNPCALGSRCTTLGWGT